MDISFVILTHNSADHIKKCINSYLASVRGTNLDSEFLIVDNGSSDETVALIEDVTSRDFPERCKSKIFKLNRNRGTTISRNIALKEATGEYIVVCDSDTEFKRGDWHIIIEFFRNHPETGIIAPCLRYLDNRVQESVRKFPTFSDKLLKLGKIFFNLPLHKKDFYPDFPWPHAKAVDTAASAFWMFPRRLLTEAGYLDEKIFYSPEDVDFCLRVWKAGRKVIFFPQLVIMHKVQRISHRKPFSYIALSHFFGLIYYFRKHEYFLSRKNIYARLNIR